MPSRGTTGTTWSPAARADIEQPLLAVCPACHITEVVYVDGKKLQPGKCFTQLHNGQIKHISSQCHSNLPCKLYRL